MDQVSYYKRLMTLLTMPVVCCQEDSCSCFPPDTSDTTMFKEHPANPLLEDEDSGL